MSSYPALHELIWLFEVEPQIKFEDLGWPTSEATFIAERDGWTVTCTIAPYMYTVELSLSHNGSQVVYLRMPEIVDPVSVDRTHGDEALIVAFERNSRLKALRLQLKPQISVGFEALPPWAES